jgi:hypothetical protein
MASASKCQCKKKRKSIHRIRTFIESLPWFPYAGDSSHDRRLHGSLSAAGEMDDGLARQFQSLILAGESKVSGAVVVA